MNNPILFSGMMGGGLGKTLAERLKIPPGNLETTQFADGELRVRILEYISGRDCIVVQSMYPKTNTTLVQLCLIADTLKRGGANRVIALVPYMGYARQDKAHRTGESISAAVVAHMLESAGVGRFFAIDIHALGVLDYFGIPAENISVLSALVRDILSRHADISPSKLILIAPDQDGAHRVKEAARLIGVTHGFVQKERDLNSADVLKETKGKDVSGDVTGKDVIILDDMISTGSTIVVASEKLKKRGAKRIFAAAAHGVFSKPPRDVFNTDVIEEVVVSDSIEQPETILFPKLHIVSSVPLLSVALQSV